MQIRQTALNGTGILMHCAVPSDSAGNGRGVFPTRLPAEKMVCLIDLQKKKIGLMRRVCFALIEPLTGPVA